MKIIAIITGNRKARIINMRTSNYDKYKIIFIDSCMYRVILSNTRRDARVIITKSFDPFLVSSLDSYIYSISGRFRRKYKNKTTSTSIFSPFSFTCHELQREGKSRSWIRNGAARGGRAEVGRRLASSLDNASTKEVIRRGLSPWRCSDSACSRPCYARRRHCLDNLAVILHAVSSVS